MLQFYFLSVLFNLVTGLVLLFIYRHRIPNSKTKDLVIKKETDDSFEQIISNKTFRLCLGILTLLTGFIKLFVVVNGKVAVFGDFIPAVAGMAGGFTILLAYYIEQSTAEVQLAEWLQKFFVININIIAYICLGASVLHFIFPGALFL